MNAVVIKAGRHESVIRFFFLLNDRMLSRECFKVMYGVDPGRQVNRAGGVMTWDEFLAEKKLYVQSWKKMKEGATEDMQKFLSKSWIVVYCKQQFDIDADFMTVFNECPSFFQNVPRFTRIKALCEEMKTLEKRIKREKENHIDLLEDKKDLQEEIAELCPGELPVDDSWRIEVRFPTVDMDLIQQIKNSPYCDQEKTMMRPASINVVLKNVL